MDVYWTHRRYFLYSHRDLKEIVKQVNKLESGGNHYAIGAVYERNQVYYVMLESSCKIFTTQKIANKSISWSTVLPITIIKSIRLDRVELFNSRGFVEYVITHY